MDAQPNPTSPPNGRVSRPRPEHDEAWDVPFPQIRIPVDYLPNGRKSLSSISLHAFGLGITLGVCGLLAVQMAYLGFYLWRLPFFVAVLAIFHYLEFDMTARYNPADAKVASFLLFTNGSAYTIAHCTAMAEVLVRTWLCSEYRPQWLRFPFNLPKLSSRIPAVSLVVLGIALIVCGQFYRSTAMKQAKSSFNHIVQHTKKEDHVLVTTGVYAISRHPSYFGFFWWAIGTQVVLGNQICLLAYTYVLWKFFAHRIFHEEKHLVQFFGYQYIQYRNRVPVLIPFIR